MLTASSPEVTPVSLPTITFLTYNFWAAGSIVYKAYAGPEKGASKTETQELFPDQLYNIPPKTVSYFKIKENLSLESIIKAEVKPTLLL